jgi:hypothetical protein
MSWFGRFDHSSFDFSIDVDVSHPKPMKGTIGMIGGRVMISKGLVLQRGYEIDALDGPVLSMKLATIVLGRAFPKGPDSIKGTVPLSYTGTRGIKFATPSAGGYIPVPWKAVGSVRSTASGAVAFDIALTMPADPRDPSKTSQTRMKGELSMRSSPVFDDRARLDGWTIYGVGPQSEQRGDATVMDYGAKPTSEPKFKTIADVRSHIAAENHPGTPDVTKNFTGFWKNNCEQAFGLQIKPFGSDGKYSIVFCGPGGCGKPEDSRHSFITGDKRYEVVSEDELIEVDRDGKKERLLRCTKDTNPVLKY